MTASAVRRRPSEGGYACGEETRVRIVMIALRLFGERGFDGVSTREIASEANVNTPALQYYFGSKEGLYVACAELVTEQVRRAADPMLARAVRLLEEDAPAVALIEAYCAIVEGLVEQLFGDEGASWSRFLAREQAGFGPGKALAVIRAQVSSRLDRTFCGIVGRLSGVSPDAQETRLRVEAINGQFKVFQANRTLTLASLGSDAYTREHGRLVRAIVVDQTRALLTRLAEKVPGVPNG
jgi:TetR/AcrR family transcriptional regulator, regulator of cefoperazone and chloramphenicol sensitivity